MNGMMMHHWEWNSQDICFCLFFILFLALVTTSALHRRTQQNIASWNDKVPVYRVCLKSKYKKVGVLPIWKVKFNISSVGSFRVSVSFRVSISFRVSVLFRVSVSLDFTFHIVSTPTFLYFDLYLNTAYAAHYVYFTFIVFCLIRWGLKLCNFRAFG